MYWTLSFQILKRFLDMMRGLFHKMYIYFLVSFLNILVRWVRDQFFMIRCKIMKKDWVGSFFCRRLRTFKRSMIATVEAKPLFCRCLRTFASGGIRTHAPQTLLRISASQIRTADRRLKPLSVTPALVFIFNEINNSLRTVGFEPTHQR